MSGIAWRRNWLCDSSKNILLPSCRPAMMGVEFGQDQKCNSLPIFRLYHVNGFAFWNSLHRTLHLPRLQSRNPAPRPSGPAPRRSRGLFVKSCWIKPAAFNKLTPVGITCEHLEDNTCAYIGPCGLSSGCCLDFCFVVCLSIFLCFFLKVFGIAVFVFPLIFGACKTWGLGFWCWKHQGRYQTWHMYSECARRWVVQEDAIQKTYQQRHVGKLTAFLSLGRWWPWKTVSSLDQTLGTSAPWYEIRSSIVTKSETTRENKTRQPQPVSTRAPSVWHLTPATLEREVIKDLGSSAPRNHSDRVWGVSGPSRQRGPGQLVDAHPQAPQVNSLVVPLQQMDHRFFPSSNKNLCSWPQHAVSR